LNFFSSSCNSASALSNCSNAKYNQLLRIAEELGDSAIYGKATWNR
jgi:enolase